MSTARAATALTLTFVVLACLPGCQREGQTDIARGNVLASQRRFDEAAEAYRAAAKAAPSDPRPRELLGHLLFDQKKGADARAAYEDALKLEPRSIEARIGLARLEADEGQPDRAMEHLGAALQAQPDNLYALLSRANLAVRRGAAGDAELAIQDTAKAMALDADHPSVLSTRARAFLAAGKTEQADEALALLAKVQPDSALLVYERARVAAMRGEREQAIALLREARKKAGAGWDETQVRADSAFATLAAEPQFAETIKEP